MPVKTRIVVDRDYDGDFQATVQKKQMFWWRDVKRFYSSSSISSRYVEDKAQNFINNMHHERTYLYPWSKE